MRHLTVGELIAELQHYQAENLPVVFCTATQVYNVTATDRDAITDDGTLVIIIEGEQNGTLC